MSEISVKQKPEKLKIVFFKTSGARAFDALKKSLSSDEDFEVISFTSAQQCIEFFSITRHAMLFYGIRVSDDLVQLISVLNHLKNDIKSGNVRVSGFSALNIDKTLSIVRKFGVQECLEESIQAKSLFFKVEKQVMMLSTQYENYLEKQKLKAKAENEKPVISFDDCFKLTNSDCWFISVEENIRFIRDTWFVDLVGPPPSFGSWVDKQNKDESKTVAWWTWFPKNRPDEFIQDDGLWQFYGRRPEFSWASGRWLFSSKRPILHFNSKNGVIDYKINTVKKTITVRKNSEHYVQALARIQLLLNQEINDQKTIVDMGPKDQVIEEEGNSPYLNADWGDLLAEDKISVDLKLQTAKGEFNFSEPEVADLFENEITLKFEDKNTIPAEIKSAVFQFNYTKDGVESKKSSNATIQNRIEEAGGSLLLEMILDSPPKEMMDEFLWRMSAKQKNVEQFLKMAKG